MSESSRLLQTTASDVMRHLSNRDYAEAVEEMRSLSPMAAAYVTAVVTEGLNRQISRLFVATLAEEVNS